MCTSLALHAQEPVTVTKDDASKRIDVSVAGQPFTSFIYPDSLAKPVLYPLHAANGTPVTRGFPMNPQPGDPVDHPHHLGLWLNFENVNGLDFWNNSYAIPEEKKSKYGWIRTDKITEAKGGKTGVIAYHANWTDQENKVLLEEETRFEISGSANRRIIDRITVLKADTVVLFRDAKDGLLGLRVARQLQIPEKETKQFSDDKGNITTVGSDTASNGNYLSSEGKTGNEVWSTRAAWCKMFGKIGNDSISISIIDHPRNLNYPTYWHARGYGLFAANPLGEMIFTNGKKSTDLQLQPGQTVKFRYRIVIENGSTSTAPIDLNKLAKEFAGRK